MKFLRLFFLLIALAVGFILYQFAPTSLSSEQIRFVVPMEAENYETIARLKSQNFIRDEKLFSFIAGLLRFPGNIEPGAYHLSHNMNLIDITNILLFKPYQKWIVLVPGLRREQVAERLGKKFAWNGAKTEEFLENAPEGYLFPDTYLLNVDYTGKEAAERLISNFNEHFDNKMQKDLLTQNVRNDTAVKIASLIERESGGDMDKAIIAGVIWNRLDKGMRLQIDATIQYALGTPSDWWPRVQSKDMKIDSPYNTYIIKSLPPGPIANPSLSSIKAAIYPAETDCLFYLHARDKTIHCSKTYEEHLENIEKYLR